MPGIDTGLKHCIGCENNLPTTSFRTLRARCRPCEWKRQRVQAQKTFDWMINFLGPWCRCCGSTKDLTIDHVIPKGWASNKFSWTQRLARYKQDLVNGLLQVLCDECNRRKSTESACDCNSLVFLYERVG